MSNNLFAPTELDWSAGAEIVTAPDQIELSPGSRGQWRVPIARRSSGENLMMHVHGVRGVKDGPTLALVAAVHGDAISGTRTVLETIARLDPHKLAGTVLAVPVANPVAFESNTRTTGQGMNTDMNNMNRVLPGNRGGWVTQKLAAALTEFVLDRADAVVDYHCGGGTSINYVLTIGDENGDEPDSFNFARLMGTPFVFAHDADPFTGTIDGYMKSRGKLCAVAEQGGNTLPAGWYELAASRVDNFFDAMGMMEVERTMPDKQFLMYERYLVRMDHGGIYIPEVDVNVLSTMVEGNTLLGRVIDPHSADVIQEVRAPYEQSAILMMRTSMTRVNPGDYGFIISDGASGRWIDSPKDWMVPRAR